MSDEQGTPYEFANLTVSAGGIGEVISHRVDAADLKFSVGDLPERTVADWERIAQEEAASIGLRTDCHPEGTLAWGTRLWCGERLLAAAPPWTVIDLVAGIKIALGMMAAGEITVERRADADGGEA